MTYVKLFILMTYAELFWGLLCCIYTIDIHRTLLMAETVKEAIFCLFMLIFFCFITMI